MSIVNFKSEWVEKCVRRALNKPEGELDSKELSKIKYMRAGGDFGGSIILELSTELPPEPFVDVDGGDEWIVCLHSETTLGEKYNLKDYIEIDHEFLVDHFKSDKEEWEYAFSREAEQNWEKFNKTIIKNNIYKDYTQEQLSQIEEYSDFLPMEDLRQFSGLTVLRLYEIKVANVAWFRAFSELKVLELAEVGIEAEQCGTEWNNANQNSVEEFSRLKQITFWCD